VGQGTLLSEMQETAARLGDWTQHIPYTAAAEYYEEPRIQENYRGHVEQCPYCKGLLETLHPTDLDSRRFAQAAARSQSQSIQTIEAPQTTEPIKGLHLTWVTGALAASVGALAMLVVVPQLQTAGVLSTPASKHAVVAWTS